MGIYSDPRGVLYEPHTGNVVELGTTQVEDYIFPAWLYNKIVYIEKKGLWPVLQDARLAERYDMAIVAGEGYATEASRMLFAQASRQQQYQLFVLHDADPDGYNIARTLREETERLPGYAVDIADIGLTMEDANARGLERETFSRNKALPSTLVLTDAARKAFTGRQTGPKSWIGERVELNAFSSPDLIAYIEEGLQRAGASGKVIPPEQVLKNEARRIAEDRLTSMATGAFSRLLQSDELVHQVVRQFQGNFGITDAHGLVEGQLQTRPTASWDRVLRTEVETLVSPHYEAIEEAMRAALQAAIQTLKL